MQHEADNQPTEPVTIDEGILQRDPAQPLTEEETAQLYPQVDAFNRVVYDFVLKYYKFIYRARTYYDGVALTMMEVHLLRDIAANAGITAAQLACKWGRTPAFLSQTIRKLEKQGLLRKTVDREDRKRNLLELTEKGQAVDLAHQQYDIRSIIATNQQLMKQFSLEQLISMREVMLAYGELINEE